MRQSLAFDNPARRKTSFESHMKLPLVKLPLDVGKEVTIERLLPLYLQLLRDESSEVRVAPLCDVQSVQEGSDRFARLVG